MLILIIAPLLIVIMFFYFKDKYKELCREIDDLHAIISRQSETAEKDRAIVDIHTGQIQNLHERITSVEKYANR